MIGYFDASAALKLVVAEAESPALRKYLSDSQDDLELHASWLLFTELHCAARRRPEEVDADAVRFALESVSLTDLEREDLMAATLGPARLRASDAIHLAVALRIEADAMIVYDVALQIAARAVGLDVLAPS